MIVIMTYDELKFFIYS